MPSPKGTAGDRASPSVPFGDGIEVWAYFTPFFTPSPAVTPKGHRGLSTSSKVRVQVILPSVSCHLWWWLYPVPLILATLSCHLCYPKGNRRKPKESEGNRRKDFFTPLFTLSLPLCLPFQGTYVRTPSEIEDKT